MTLSLLLPDPIVRALNKRLLLSAISAPSGELPFWRALIEQVVYHRLSRADIDSFFHETLDFHLHYRFSPTDLPTGLGTSSSWNRPTIAAFRVPHGKV